jgi:hypothetical protein
MTTGYVGNRHAGLRRFLQHHQFLIDGVPTTTLDSAKDFDPIYGTRHSRMPRLTPSLSLCGYVRSKWGLLQHYIAVPNAANAHSHVTAGRHCTSPRGNRQIVTEIR